MNCASARLREAGRGLGPRHRSVDGDAVVAGEEAQEAEDLADRFARRSARRARGRSRAMAPALMNGLRGRPSSNSSWTIELKADPEGSRPTCVQSHSPSLPSASVSRKTLEMLWIENGISASPGDIDHAVEGDHREAEMRSDRRERVAGYSRRPCRAFPARRARRRISLDQSLRCRLDQSWTRRASCTRPQAGAAYEKAARRRLSRIRRVEGRLARVELDDQVRFHLHRIRHVGQAGNAGEGRRSSCCGRPRCSPARRARRAAGLPAPRTSCFDFSRTSITSPAFSGRTGC